MFESDKEMTRNKFLSNQDMSEEDIQDLGYKELIKYKNITHKTHDKFLGKGRQC